MLKNSYVLNTNDSATTYIVTTDTVQSRNRRQVKSTEPVRSHVNVQVAQKRLIQLSDWEAQVTMAAEQIIRNKKVMSDNDKAIVAVARSIKEFYYNV